MQDRPFFGRIYRRIGQRLAAGIAAQAKSGSSAAATNAIHACIDKFIIRAGRIHVL
jgi:hypothetical protein